VSNLLSIRAAAREAGGRRALHADGRWFSFAELAAAVEPRIAALTAEDPAVLVGVNTLDTVLNVYALLELRRPVLLLHPKLTPTEQAEQIKQLQRAGNAPPIDTAAILFTSGTTGRARGAALTRAALLASAQASAANLGWRDDDCWLLALPLARVGGFSILTRCLAARRSVALVPAFDATAFPQWIEQRKATLTSLVPTMLTQLLGAHPEWQPPSHVRAVLIGGAPAAPKLLARAARRRVPIVITYGCTETCSQVVATPYEHRFNAGDHAVGRPLDQVELRIEDGRILVRGPMRMAGYLGEPPLAPSEWLDTGDLGEIDAEGCVHIHARRHDLIVSGGENVYPAEVERILEEYPGIAGAAVFGIPDETWGQVVAALLVADHTAPHPTAANNGRGLEQFIAGRLASFKRPRRVAWVTTLPLTPGGKLDRAALPALAQRLQPMSR
jgi:O-succinylbenzoic acid--CoA ligase